MLQSDIILEPLLDGERTYSSPSMTLQKLMAQTILCFSEYVHYILCAKFLIYHIFR
jgi:hypothetical protein